MARTAFVTLLAASVAAACSGELPDPALVDTLRIVGVRADPPAAPVGTTVAVDALVLQPDLEAPAPDRAWFVCVLEEGVPQDSCATAAKEGLPPPCSVDPEARVCLLDTPTYRLPERALANRPEGEPGQVVLTLVAAPAGGLAGCTPTSCRVGVKRVTVLPAQAPAGRNPELTDFRLVGDTLAATLAPGQDTATLFLSWYVTRGELDRFRSDGDAEGLTNAWTSDGPGLAAVVLRDDRGGEAWLTTTR